MNTGKMKEKIKDILDAIPVWGPWLLLIVLYMMTFICFYKINIYYPQKVEESLEKIDADATSFYTMITNCGKTGMVLSPATLDEIYESEDLAYGCRNYKELKNMAESGAKIEDKHVTLNYSTYYEKILEFKAGLAEVKYSSGEYYVIRIIREL